LSIRAGLEIGTAITRFNGESITIPCLLCTTLCLPKEATAAQCSGCSSRASVVWAEVWQSLPSAWRRSLSRVFSVSQSARSRPLRSCHSSISGRRYGEQCGASYHGSCCVEPNGDTVATPRTVPLGGVDGISGVAKVTAGFQYSVVGLGDALLRKNCLVHLRCALAMRSGPYSNAAAPGHG